MLEAYYINRYNLKSMCSKTDRDILFSTHEIIPTPPHFKCSVLTNHCAQDPFPGFNSPASQSKVTEFLTAVQSQVTSRMTCYIGVEVENNSDYPNTPYSIYLMSYLKVLTHCVGS